MNKINKKDITIGAFVILAVIAGFLVYQKLNPKQLPSYLVQAVGKIDGDLVNLNTKYPGRIVKLDLDTGDEVKKDQIVAVLDSKEYRKNLASLNYQIQAKQNELNFTKTNIENSINKAKIAINIKQKELSALNEKIASLQAVLKQDKKDEKRLSRLVAKKLAQPHDLELAKLKTTTDTHTLNALYQNQKQLQLAIDIAKNDLDTAIASKENIKALEHGIEALKQQKAQIQTMIDELTIKSPIDGYVDTKIANKGEVVGAGMPVVSLVNPDSFYLSIFVDELTNGKIKIGDEAEIFLDTYPNNPIPAKVIRIAKKAEFTPKDVAVKSDRITRVYEVRLKPTNKEKLKLGLPATGVILIGNGELPSSLNQIPEL